jgi:hypothetical protein
VAFHPASIKLAAAAVIERRSTFLNGSWVNGNMERAGRLAALAHNWPTEGGADYYANNGHVQNPTGICTWLPRDKAGNLVCRFPDGLLVQTRQDWADYYAMGGRHGEGQTTRFVTSW